MAVLRELLSLNQVIFVPDLLNYICGSIQNRVSYNNIFYLEIELIVILQVIIYFLNTYLYGEQYICNVAIKCFVTNIYIFVNIWKKSITCRTAASGNAMVWQASVEGVTLTYHNTLFVLIGPVDSTSFSNGIDSGSKKVLYCLNRMIGQLVKVHTSSQYSYLRHRNEVK